MMFNTRLLPAITIAVSSLTFPFANASAAGNNYVGVQYASLNFDTSGDTFNPAAVVGRFGHFITDNFAIEARAGTGVTNDSIHVPAGDVTIKLDRLLGIYGVGQLAIGEKGTAYALLGYSSAKATAKAGGSSVSEYDEGPSFGIGAQFDAGKNVSYNAEYTNYFKSSDSASGYDIVAFSIGLSVGF